MKINADKYKNEPVRYPALEVVDLLAEGRAITEKYRNVVISKVNDGCLRLAVFEEDYLWHHHPASDELFIVIEGCLAIDFEDGRELKLTSWQSVTIPAGTLHRTRAIGRTINLCFEQSGAETIFAESTEKTQ